MFKKILTFLIILTIGATHSSGFASGFKFKVSVVDGATNEPAKMVKINIYEYLDPNKYSTRNKRLIRYGYAFNLEGGTVECELDSKPDKKIRVDVSIIDELDDGIMLHFLRANGYPLHRFIMTIPEDSVESYTHPTITINPKKTD